VTVVERVGTRASGLYRIAHAKRAERRVRGSLQLNGEAERTRWKKEGKNERKENRSTDHRLLIKKNGVAALPRGRVAVARSPFCEAAK